MHTKWKKNPKENDLNRYLYPSYQIKKKNIKGLDGMNQEPWNIVYGKEFERRS